MKSKPIMEDLKKRYSHFEWHHCLTRDFWVVQAVNAYGHWGYVEFTEYLTQIDTPSVEAWLMALDDFRRLGRSMTRDVNNGRYVEPPAVSDRKVSGKKK